MIEKIISGGQTGADQGALMAAQILKIETGGYIVKNYMTETGPNHDLKKYNLQELNSPSYVTRSIKNIQESDGTLVFYFKESVGTAKTIGYCISGKWTNIYEQTSTPYKPLLIINKFDFDYNIVKEFIKKYKIKTLNVAGNRQSHFSYDFEENVKNYIINLFKQE